MNDWNNVNDWEWEVEQPEAEYPNYTVFMIDTKTGEERTVQVNMTWHWASYFIWTEGNWSCDCNRSMEFGDHDDEADGFTGFCNNGDTPNRFRVPYATMPDGKRIIIDQ